MLLGQNKYFENTYSSVHQDLTWNIWVKFPLSGIPIRREHCSTILLKRSDFQILEMLNGLRRSNEFYITKSLKILTSNDRQFSSFMLIYLSRFKTIIFKLRIWPIFGQYFKSPHENKYLRYKLLCLNIFAIYFSIYLIFMQSFQIYINVTGLFL